jgi:hypothetical protein
MTRLWLLLVLGAAAASPAFAQETIADYTRDFEKRDGYFPLYWDGTDGRLLLEVPRLEQDFLYLTSAATGLGHTRLGVDRGQIEDVAIARFTRVGPTVLLVLTNPRFRAVGTDNPALVRAVEESFPTSTVAAFDVLAEEDGRLLVDATGHFLTDHLELARRLQQADQGTFRLSGERSTVFLPRTKGFPANTEVEVSLTFTSANAGSLVRQQAPTGAAVTLRVHHSLVQLPDDGYTPREADPRIGTFGVFFYDFAKPLFRPGRAHRVLSRRRDPGALPLGLPRGHPLVELGLRGRGIPRRISRRRHAARHGSDGRTVPRGPVGPALQSRLLHRSDARRPTNG